MLTRNAFLVVVNLALVAGACEDETDLRKTDGPAAVPPMIGHAPDGGAAAPVPEVEVKTQAIWVNPGASPCIGDQPAMTVRLYRWTSGAEPCLQFPSNMEINFLGYYTWPAPDGTNLNDNVRRAIGSVQGHLGKCQRVTLVHDWMFIGPWAQHQVCYLGNPGQGWNVWLYHPDGFDFGASSVRYEVW
jgi:hypothetical protein